MEWINILSLGCTFFTIIMFSTGLPQCLQMIKQKNTKNIPFLPYLMTNVNCIAWIVYGQMTHNSTVILVNIVGSLLQTLYMSIFIFFSTTKTNEEFAPNIQEKEVKQSTLAAFIFSSTWFVTTRLISSMALAVQIVGVLCCTITILMFSSPLAEITTVIRQKSTAILSFPLTVASVHCAGMWTAFGFLIKDTFIIIPNIVGVLTSLFRFYLFYKYRSETSATLPL